MNRKQANALIARYCGYGKTETDFSAMIRELAENSVYLMEGTSDYSSGMESKRYSYQLAFFAEDEDGEECEKKNYWLLDSGKVFCTWA